MGEVISFDGAQRRFRAQPNGPQVARMKDDPLAFNRRSLFRRFVLGAMGVRAAGRRHPDGERGFESDIRAALIGAPIAPDVCFRKKAA
jgi:hypothetical protein